MKDATYATLEQALDAALEHASHVLPAQGPIGNFVHHNTLHAYQHLPFHDAIRAASSLHDAEGYLSESQYRRALHEGRFKEADIERAMELRARALGADAHERIGGHSRLALERLLLHYGLRRHEGLPFALRPDLPKPVGEAIRAATRGWLDAVDPVRDAELDRFLAPEGSMAALRGVLSERGIDAASARALWAVCRRLAPPDPLAHSNLLGRVGRDRTARDLLRALSAEDPSALTNPVLIDFLAAYLDEGMARWSMPRRARGMLACFVDAMGVDRGALAPFLRRAHARLEHAQALGTPAKALAVALLKELGVSPDDYAPYLSRTLLELPGWSGMVARLAHVPGDREAGAPPASLLELTIIRLALDLEAYEACTRSLGYQGRIADFGAFAARRLLSEPTDNVTSAQALFDLCQVTGIAAPILQRLGPDFAERACTVIDELDEQIRPLLHEAYEHAHLREVLDAVAQHREAGLVHEPAAPKFQVMFCIDDREESIRRYFEELDPAHLTYGVAGFFGVAMRFCGIDDASPVALCPVVVEPGHAIDEVAIDTDQSTLEKRRARRGGAAMLRFVLGDASRTFTRGLALLPLVGLSAVLPLVLRVLFPHTAERLKRWFAAQVVPTPRTQLTLGRPDDVPAEGGLSRGFTVAEQADRVAGTLENVGIVRDFAPLVTVLGHGASTVNNPHHSAYDCGACGGRNGGPNGRAFAAMANDPAVRTALRARGIEVPDGTWFIGGLHDTTTDEVRLFDLELVPAARLRDLAALQKALDHARAVSALERCRKFEHAPANLSPQAALRHVEERAVDLSQARPELGHATNAVCIVGRRSLSRDLFLDRRSFLVSYRADIDPDLKILERILGAVVPVGAGINLEYYFSSVDNEVWGSGTKLPHNLSGLLGVMEGASGDLRTGLPRQMIEVHDPVRLLSIVEATPEAILEVASRKPEVAELVTKEWVRVASVHPESGAIQVFDGGVFRPYSPGESTLPTVGSAEEWYRGNLGFLSPVRIVKGRHRAA